MTKVRRFGDLSSGLYVINCPACGEHVIAVEKPFGNGAQWTFNGNLEKPTFSPSLLVRTGKYADPEWQKHIKHWPEDEKQDYLRHSVICHSFIRDGQIQYCGDSTHRLSGQTVPLLEVKQ